MTRDRLTQTELKEFMHYCPDTGIFTWKPRSRSLFKTGRDCDAWNSTYSGKPSGCINGVSGYMQIGINYVVHKAHRLAFLYVYGYMPKEVLHDDQNPSNNKIDNLSDGTHAQNMKNRARNSNNKSGVTGVCWHKGSEVWQAQITVDDKRIYLGSSKDKDAVIKIRKDAEIEYGFHKNHGLRLSQCP